MAQNYAPSNNSNTLQANTSHHNEKKENYTSIFFQTLARV